MMRGWLNRVAGLLVGSILLYSSVDHNSQQQLLGLYAPNTAERIGYDLSILAIGALGIWAIYRGIRPKQKPTTELV
jgi:hypothetical protein